MVTVVMAITVAMVVMVTVVMAITVAMVVMAITVTADMVMEATVTVITPIGTTITGTMATVGGGAGVGTVMALEPAGPGRHMAIGGFAIK
jgi:hypothetical protein